MPNFCKNKVTISHHDKRQSDKIILAFNRGKLFETFIPIDNLSHNDKTTECIKKWGTKWDVGHDIGDDIILHDDNKITMLFQTPWTPPIEWYCHIIKEGFIVNALYWEPFSCFAGIYNNEENLFYDLCTQNSVFVPDELDRVFKIKSYLNQIDFRT